jgi:hypothetical protein
MSRKFLAGLVTMLMATAMATNASAFDGNRKGFAIGFGAGPSLTSWTVQEGRWTSDRQNDFGFNTIFKLGYGANENLLIYYTNNVSWYSGGEVETLFFMNGITGIGGAYYFKPEGPTPYFHALAGVSVCMTPFEQYHEKDVSTGTGFGAGIGYELAKHYSIEATLMYSMFSDNESDEEVKALAILVTVNALGY